MDEIISKAEQIKKKYSKDSLCMAMAMIGELSYMNPFFEWLENNPKVNIQDIKEINN
ncbi:MAG: hypothetical protein ABJI69_09085 [Balneola sp.]